MRRALLVTLLFALPIALSTGAQQTAQQAPPEITPDQLWSALVQGNKAYMAGKIVYDDLKAEREMLRGSQLPPITVLSCADSRVPPELIFNQSLGGLFVVREAGNIADDFSIASIEFAISNGWTKVIVVLGHEDCGAIKASLGVGDPGTPALLALARRIRMSFVGIPHDAKDPANVRKATEANVRASAAQLLAASAMIRDAVTTGKIKVVTAYYELGSGEVKVVQ